MHSCAYVSVVYCNGCVVAVGKHSIIIIIIKYDFFLTEK